MQYQTPVDNSVDTPLPLAIFISMPYSNKRTFSEKGANSRGFFTVRQSYELS